MPTTRWLTSQEAEAWRAVRDMGQPLWTALGRALQRESDLSLADYQILVELSDRDDDTMAYRELAAATDWEKSRLSHQLARMERRDLVTRRKCTTDARSADVIITTAGRAAIEQAAPGHVAAVRRLLIDLLTAEEVAALRAIGEKVREAIASSSQPA